MTKATSIVTTDEEAWKYADKKDWWVFDKLILARALSYRCGPAGMPVPKPGKYIVRPCVNTQGMGLGASAMFLEKNTTHLPPGYFWCEFFDGTHYSHDYMDGAHKVCYQGVKDIENPRKFSHWFRDTQAPKLNLPSFIQDLVARYKNVNIECINDKIIEVHLRASPDWVKHDADELIPVHVSEDSLEYITQHKLKFVEDPAADRVGFFILKR